MTYKVTFEPLSTTVEVDPALYPYGHTGRPGSLLDIAITHGVRIEHACGGTAVCSTCHVEVVRGSENLSPAEDHELDLIDAVPGATLNTRIACQAVVKGDVTVRLPKA